jgi:hypothetical protein
LALVPELTFEEELKQARSKPHNRDEIEKLLQLIPLCDPVIASAIKGC